MLLVAIFVVLYQDACCWCVFFLFQAAAVGTAASRCCSIFCFVNVLLVSVYRCAVRTSCQSCLLTKSNRCLWILRRFPIFCCAMTYDVATNCRCFIAQETLPICAASRRHRYALHQDACAAHWIKRLHRYHDVIIITIIIIMRMYI